VDPAQLDEVSAALGSWSYLLLHNPVVLS